MWRAFDARYEFSPAEEQLLIEACRTLDLLDALEGDLLDRGLTVSGSRGQPVQNPSIPTLGQHRAVLTRLLAALAPQEEASPSMSASRLAQQRWGRHGS
jgi:hypothetical protein